MALTWCDSIRRISSAIGVSGAAVMTLGVMMSMASTVASSCGVMHVRMPPRRCKHVDVGQLAGVV